MEEIMNFFEDLNEVVYITDMDTYEIVYMNKKIREEYGGYPVEHFAGKKCYEVFQRNSTPCKICTNHKLKYGGFVEWQYYNPILDKCFMLKDRMIEKNGRRYRVEIALDISNQNRRNAMFKEYQDMEGLANEGFRLALQEDIPDKSIDVILEYLGKALNGERTYVVEQNEKGGDDNTYEWVRKGIKPEKENLQNLSPEVCAEWYQHFNENRSITIENMEDIRDVFPIQYEVLKRQNIRALVVVPLYKGKRAIGFYGIDNPSGISLDYAANILQIISNFIVSTLRRRELYRQLKEMSQYDCLTGLGNRYAMNEYVEHLKDGQDMGIIYCDMTGLKKINDEKGHKAGDRLLVRGAESLKKVFDQYAVFRIGGDEFLILCAGISEALMNEKTEELKKYMQDSKVIAAVGTAWQSGIETAEIDGLVTEAENKMYADKAAYYTRNGMDRRR